MNLVTKMKNNINQHIQIGHSLTLPGPGHLRDTRVEGNLKMCFLVLPSGIMIWVF